MNNACGVKMTHVVSFNGQNPTFRAATEASQRPLHVQVAHVV
jgi:hypothetical protein